MRRGVVQEARRSQNTKRLRALILEDSPDDLELLLLQLKHSGFDVIPTQVEKKEQFQAVISKGEFDVVFADYHLPDWTGIEAIRELRNLGRDIPFLLVTGTLGEEGAVECIKQGANDYILKEHMSRLPEALERALTEKTLRDESARAQQALRLSEARNRDLIENSVYGIFRLSGDGEFLDANPALLRILGCTGPENLKSLNLGRDVFRFPEQYARFMTVCRQRGQINGAEAEWRRCDGGLVSTRLHIRRLFSGQGQEELEVIAEDVTQLRAMERQVQQAQKFEAIGQLAGGIAHDFNNVVGAILGWAELGFDQNRNHPQVAEQFRRIREQAERAAALTRELLAFARKQVLQPRAVDLNQVTTGLVSFLDKVIGKHIEFKFLNGKIDTVKADPTQIEQVLMNLCLNARDAMPDGGRMVIETEMAELDDAYCRFYPYVTPGRYAVLSVSDTGVGMDSATRERIFEPFFTTKERGKGTGMGLATVYGIVKQHGGFIHVRVYLPALEGSAAIPDLRKVPTTALTAARGSETILIADDHESIREMARQTLQGLGYRVLCAADGEEGLQLCQHEEPALAILDINMPKLGGASAAAELVSRFPALAILLTSGYSADSSGMSTVASARYLQKPYSPTTLGRVVREILDQRGKREH